MHFLSYALALLTASAEIASAIAIQHRQNGNLCANPRQRKEWRKLSNAEKDAFIAAQKCLIGLPSQTNLPGAKTLWDDLIKAHQLQNDVIHGTAWFFPFHRYFIFAHETLLREKCGYNGAHPYWDETLDAGNFSESPLFNDQHGFGGRGTPNVDDEQCVQTGPFAGMRLTVGPGTANTEHCLSRRINDAFSMGASKERLERCASGGPDQMQGFQYWANCIENPRAGNAHPGGHGGVGGVMQDPIASPGDPMFYMHHAFIDWVWWSWQWADPTARLMQIEGSQNKWENIPVTLNDQLGVLGLIPNTTIAEVMDTRSQYACYTYV